MVGDIGTMMTSNYVANLKSQTFAFVEQALGHGEGRWYGRGLLRTGDSLPLRPAHRDRPALGRLDMV
jgi:hypothetical protein